MDRAIDHFSMYIPIEVQPKQRPRFSGGKVYTPKETKRCENDIALIVKNHMNRHKIDVTQNRVLLEALFCFGPKIKTTDNSKQMYPKKPDIDNLLKTLMDSLNKIVYEDDRQVIGTNAMKCYAKNRLEPGIYLTVKVFP